MKQAILEALILLWRVQIVVSCLIGWLALYFWVEVNFFDKQPVIQFPSYEAKIDYNYNDNAPARFINKKK